MEDRVACPAGRLLWQVQLYDSETTNDASSLISRRLTSPMRFLCLWTKCKNEGRVKY